MNTNHIALYWDFENIHASLFESARTFGRYAEKKRTQQPDLVNIQAIVEFARSIGNLAINRAYGDWDYMGSYRHSLNLAGVDLIQLFSKGANGKNGADIRLALDVIEDIYRFQQLSHIIVVSGDSDFLSLAQKSKQLNRQIIGIGARESTNQIWAKNCNQFQYYNELPGLRPSSGDRGGGN